MPRGKQTHAIIGRVSVSAASWTPLSSPATPYPRTPRPACAQVIVYDPVVVPPSFSAEASSIVTQLLEKDPTQRLGHGGGAGGSSGMQQLQRHEFFAGIDWVRLLAKEIEPVRTQCSAAVNNRALGSGAQGQQHVLTCYRRADDTRLSPHFGQQLLTWVCRVRGML
jgi:hypothetical protein